MPPQPVTVMRFASLDVAESALDWIGLEFADGEGCFEGTLDRGHPGDAELLDAALADPETPEPVRALAAALRELLTAMGGTGGTGEAGGAGDAPATRAWRVAFDG